jgi:hypothetical protein
VLVADGSTGGEITSSQLSAPHRQNADVICEAESGNGRLLEALKRASRRANIFVVVRILEKFDILLLSVILNANQINRSPKAKYGAGKPLFFGVNPLAAEGLLLEPEPVS